MIIHFDYDKAARWPDGHGYSVTGATLRGIVWHSTEHAPRQSFAAVCRYLRDSPAVSVHYVVGGDGMVQRILDPVHTAWGAGVCRYQGRTEFNQGYVQIELFHYHNGPPYPLAQLAAARALARQLQADHPTIQRSEFFAHRWIASPPGRRSDPTDLSDAWLRAWFARL